MSSSSSPTTYMPSRGHPTAPRFDPARPRELWRYFDELELLFVQCEITDPVKQKKFARHYVDIDTSDLWGSIPQFAPAFSFDSFIDAIIEFYPGAEDSRKWTLADLDALIGERTRLGIRNVTDLGNYHRSFLNITQYLRKKGRIADLEQSRAYA